MEKLRVGIIRGGDSRNYNISLTKGGSVISRIIEDLSHKYKAVDIFVDKDNVWHAGGVPISPPDLSRRVDVVWDLSMHAPVGKIVESISVPYIGNGSFHRMLEDNKDALSKHVKDLGIKVPRSILLSPFREDIDGPRETYAHRKAKEIWNKFSAPWVVKSFREDKNMGVHLAKTFPELVLAIEDGVRHDDSVLIEEFISGKVGALHSISGFRNEDIYVFPPENVTIKEKETLVDLMKKLHKHLDINHYLKIDYVLHPKLGFHILNMETSVDVRPGSHLMQSAKRVGAEMHHIIEHFIDNLKLTFR